jgi:hypothetical protein
MGRQSGACLLVSDTMTGSAWQRRESGDITSGRVGSYKAGSGMVTAEQGNDMDDGVEMRRVGAIFVMPSWAGGGHPRSFLVKLHWPTACEDGETGAWGARTTCHFLG